MEHSVNRSGDLSISAKPWTLELPQVRSTVSRSANCTKLKLDHCPSFLDKRSNCVKPRSRKGARKTETKNGYHLSERWTSNKNGSIVSMDSLPKLIQHKHSHIFSDNKVVLIPKRPRNFCGKRKCDNVIKQTQSSKSEAANALCYPGIHESGINQNNLVHGTYICKDLVHEHKSNGLRTSDAELVARGENGGATSHWTPVSKDMKSSWNKRKKPSKYALDASFTRTLKTLQEDEENLEENAARMLSSRFDPTYTSPCRNTAESILQFTDCGAPTSAELTGSENGEIERLPDNALRPRENREQKQLGKRRHYYELNGRIIDPLWIINKRIKLLEPLGKSWCFGIVKQYDSVSRLHHIKYYDSNEKLVNLQHERFKLLLLPAEKCYLQRKSEGQVNAKAVDNIESSTSMGSRETVSQQDCSTSWTKDCPSDWNKLQSSSCDYDGSLLINLHNASRNHERCFPDVFSSRTKVNDLCLSSILPEWLMNRTASVNSGTTHARCQKITLVYHRKRFRNPGHKNHLPENLPTCTKSSDISPHSNFEKPFASEVTYLSNVDRILSHKLGLSFSQFFMSPRRSRKQVLKVNIPFPWNIDKFLCVGSDWGDTLIMRMQIDPIVTLWPSIRLEILIVNNLTTTRRISFDGCLMQAMEFVSLILAMIHIGNRNESPLCTQQPQTSIWFKFSFGRYIHRELLFVLHCFGGVNSSQWSYLGNKFRQQCKVTKHPSSLFSHPQINTFLDGEKQKSLISSTGQKVAEKVSWRRLLQDISSIQWHCHVHGKRLNVAHTFISFAEAPTFFWSMHLQLMIESNIAFIRFYTYNRPLIKSSLLICNLTHEGALRGETLEHLSDVIPISKCPCVGYIKGQSVSSPNSSQGDICNGHIVTSMGPGSTKRYHFCQAQEQDVKSGSVLASRQHMYDGSSLYEERSNREEPVIITSSASNTHDATSVGSPWHQNHLVSSFAMLCSNDNSGFCPYGLDASQEIKALCQSSLPSQVPDHESKSRSSFHKGRPCKRTKNNHTQLIERCTLSPEILLSSSCEANVLVINEDRGWRERGAQVVLEPLDTKELKLIVMFSGVHRFSHKAHQFLQPGTANRFTHAMMWRGDKDWILEFTDRSQWNIFKEMYTECYNQNIRAASVKNIPIPGVRVVDDMDVNLVETSSVWSPQSYYRQIGTEIDLALDPNRVVYDLESEDEEWIADLRNSSDIMRNSCPGITEEMLERVMDMFEKISYAHKQDSFTDKEIEQFMDGLGSMDAIKAIYNHWQDRRKKKGLPLIRQFQLPLWKQYEQQLKVWESTIIRTADMRSSHRMAIPQRPAMHAFCLKPRGLEARNKGSKQRSVRRIPAAGNNGACSRDSEGFHYSGRVSNTPLNEDNTSLTESTDPIYSQDAKVSKVPLPGSAIVGLLSRTAMYSDEDQHLKSQRGKSKTFGPQNGLPVHNKMLMPPSEKEEIFPSEIPSKLQILKHLYSDACQSGNNYKIRKLDDFRLRDAVNAAHHAKIIAQRKREKAKRLHHRAEVLLHRAVVALTTAEAIKASDDGATGNG